MKALTIKGPGVTSLEQVPRPALEWSADAIVRVEAAAVDDADVRFVTTGAPGTAGRIIGREAVGTVVEIGLDVAERAVGDRVLLTGRIACGRCAQCRAGSPGHCTAPGAGELGQDLDGVVADYVRVSFIDNSSQMVEAGITGARQLAGERAGVDPVFDLGDAAYAFEILVSGGLPNSPKLLFVRVD